MFPISDPNVSKLEDLVDIGFRQVGTWSFDEDAVTFELLAMKSVAPALYVFSVDNVPMYVGRTKRSLNDRLVGYQNPSPSQRTKTRVHAEIESMLRAGHNVAIYAFVQQHTLSVGEFHLNLPAALEEDIIRRLDPPWNIGKRGASDQWIGSFSVVVHKTYYTRGFFNVPVSQSHLFDSDARPITIDVTGSSVPISGIINRKANVQTNAPRIMGRTPLRDWFQTHVPECGTIVVDVRGKNHISVKPTES